MQTKLGFYSATYGTGCAVTADDIKKVPYNIVELYLAELQLCQTIYILLQCLIKKALKDTGKIFSCHCSTKPMKFEKYGDT